MIVLPVSLPVHSRLLAVEQNFDYVGVSVPISPIVQGSTIFAFPDPKTTSSSRTAENVSHSYGFHRFFVPASAGRAAEVEGISIQRTSSLPLPFCAQWLSCLCCQALSDLIHTLFLYSKEVEFQTGMSYTEPTRRTLWVRAIATVHP